MDARQGGYASPCVVLRPRNLAVLVYALRHTFASFALKSGWPVGQLAKWLGHSDINDEIADEIATTYSIDGHPIAEEPPDLKFE